MVGAWSHAELVTEGETVKLRQERDVTQAVALLAALLMGASLGGCENMLTDE